MNTCVYNFDTKIEVWLRGKLRCKKRGKLRCKKRRYLVYDQHVAEVKGVDAPKAKGVVEAPQDFLFRGIFINLYDAFIRQRGKIVACDCL